MNNLKSFESFDSLDPKHPIDIERTGYKDFDPTDETDFELTPQDWEQYPFYAGAISYFVLGERKTDSLVYIAMKNDRKNDIQYMIEELVNDYREDYPYHKEEINVTVEDFILLGKEHL